MPARKPPLPKLRTLTADEQALADRLTARANELRAAAEADGDSLTIRAAIDIAAFQLGLADTT
jgi:hypothetical protein